MDYDADIKSELPEGDIGEILRTGRRRDTRARPSHGSLASRVGHLTHTGRITKVRKGAPRAPGQGRLPIMRATPRAERKFDTERFGMRAFDDFESGLRRLETDRSSMVVAVHGACRSNGRAGAKAGYGVFVSGLAEDLNCSGLVPYLSPQTNQYAELFAAMRALDVVHDLIIAGEDLTHVVIKSNLEYLVDGLSVSIWKWVGNGFMNCQGVPMVNGRAFKYLHEKVVLLERELRRSHMMPCGSIMGLVIRLDQIR
ncbi:hypothetical protein LZ554_002781 [Drepanopeziza brunnea f. sp. 'monogermtubi']|nr:hypothetical protein LZ554_002781 [Drepanopeziza brunnea f. sp. 'monogermtubi']